MLSCGHHRQQPVTQRIGCCRAARRGKVLCYSGLAGFGELERPVTNSNKARCYSNCRLYFDDELVDVIVTGEVPY